VAAPEYKVERRPWPEHWKLNLRPWQITREGEPIGYYPSESDATLVMEHTMWAEGALEQARRVARG